MSISTRYLVAFVATLIGLFLALACSTVPPAIPQSCDSMLRATAGEYQLVQTQASPVGAVAVLVLDGNARLLFLTPVRSLVDYMTTKGWKHAGECNTPEGETHQLLQRDIQIPVTPGQKA